MRGIISHICHLIRASMIYVCQRRGRCKQILQRNMVYMVSAIIIIGSMESS